MGSGWSDLVRIPFFSFLPNVMLGLGFLYVLQWTGVISSWNQLFEPIYEIGPEWAVPNWLTALFILLVLFVLGEVVATFGDVLTLVPFLPSDWSEHIYFFDYNSQGSYPHKFPVTERCTPFKKYGVSTEVLWYLFKDEWIAEISERDYAIKGRLYSGLFMLSVVYLGLFLGKLVLEKSTWPVILVILVLIVLIMVILLISKCGKCPSIFNELDTMGEFDFSGLRRYLCHLMVCSHWILLLLSVSGILWLCLWYPSRNSPLELIARTFFVALLAIYFYIRTVSERVYANALNYTHYIKMRGYKPKQKE